MTQEDAGVSAVEFNAAIFWELYETSRDKYTVRVSEWVTNKPVGYEFFHISRLIWRIEQEKITQKLKTWLGIEPRSLFLAVKHFDNYTIMLSVLVSSMADFV